MKKHLMLGVNSKTQMCCTLECLLPFEQLDEQNLEEKEPPAGEKMPKSIQKYSHL